MANAALFPILPVWGNFGGTAEPTMSGPEGATQTFIRGAILVNSAGFIVEASPNPTAILGVARAAGHNLAVAGVATAGTAVAGGIIDPTSPNALFTPIGVESMVFEINVDKASAQGGALAVVSAANLWSSFGITKDAVVAGVGGSWYLDVDKSAANQAVYLVGFKDAAGTVNGRVYVTFLGANNALK